MTLTLSLCIRVIGSAHSLPEKNIWLKFNGDNPKGSGDMEQTRNSSLSPFACDIDFESR